MNPVPDGALDFTIQSSVHPVPHGPRDIRLFKLLSPKGSDNLRCDLVVASLDEPPPYVSISYTWGDPTATHQIHCSNGQVLGLTTNADILLCNLPDSCRGHYLWLDSLCIDQGNVLEKNHQVRLMKAIYSKAASVFVWLGEPTEDSDIKVADLINRIHRDTRLPPMEALSDRQRSAAVAQFSDFVTQVLPSEWTALKSLLRQPWFTRLWVIQEVALSLDVNVGYGTRTIPWAIFVHVLATLCQYGNYAQVNRLIDFVFLTAETSTVLRQLVDIDNVRQLLKRNKTLFFQDAILICNSRKATDPRDQLYALLGLVADGLDNELNPDYRKSIQAVYTDTTRHLLTRDQRLAILKYAGIGYSRALPDLPSWVTDWNIPPVAMIDLTRWARTAGYRTDDDIKPQIQCGTRSNKLSIRGVLLDIVCGTSAIYERTALQPGAVSDWCDEALAIASSLDPYPTGEPWEEAFWRTLLANKMYDGSQAPSSWAQNYQSFQTMLELDRLDVASGPSGRRTGKLNDSSPDWTGYGSAHEKHQAGLFLMSSRQAIINRSFCATENGYIGLTPGAEPGDLICSLFGAPVPYVLRVNEFEEGHGQTYTLVGECYVHGFMDGKLVGEKRNAALDFILV
ncbi:hypothetical protein MMC28_007454 [Mycoblastus sanguinarius]|nr:hypothetical protein [Mycoblastus sanguinarius]